jgi:multidrug efflux pump
MKLSVIAVQRPVATTLLTAGVALAGLIAFTVLPVASLPSADSPNIMVNASLPGANPEVMATSVATPLERQFGHIAGITEMTSNSSTGSTNINLQFSMSRDINAAAREVQAAISQARNYLPTGMPSNPAYRKMNSAESPICIIGVASQTYDQGARYDTVSTILSQRLSQISGVGQVQVGGGALPAVRVEINPLQLEHYGISLSQVAGFLQQQNAHTPTGSLSDGKTVSYITVNDQISKAVDYRPLIIGTHNGAAVRLGDVADVVDSQENRLSAGYLNGVPSVQMMVYKQAGANIVETVDAIRNELPVLESSIPKGMKLKIVLDMSTTIRASLRDVERTLVIAVVLVILVVFVFLRSWRATIIPGVAVPVSLIGTFAAMYLLNYSLDNLSLMALTICTGFVIDDAIVVMENIVRYIEGGTPLQEAVFKGVSEVGFTVLSMSISLVAVFIPILLMGGVVGRLFREFAVTLSMAIFISMILSLTSTPMLCSQLFRKGFTRNEQHGWVYRFVGRLFDRLVGAYEISLRWVIRDHSALVLLVFLVTIALNVVYLTRISKGLFPTEDNGMIMGGLQGSQDSSFAKMDGALKRAEAIVMSDPAIANVMGSAGGSGFGGGATAMMFISLKPRDQRTASAADVVDRLRPKLSTLKEGQVFLMAGQDFRVGGRQSNTAYQYTLQADTPADLRKWVPMLQREMKKLPSITDVNSDMQAGALQTYLTYDRDTAARLGLTPSDIDNTLNDSFSQADVSTIYKTLNQYHVVLEAQPQFTQGPDTLNDTFTEGSSGSIPLSVVSTYQMRTGPQQVSHTGLFPSSTISFNLAQGMTLGQATADIHLAENKLNIPKTVHGSFSGTANEFQRSMGSILPLVAVAIIAIYIVLGMLFESFMHPITILSTLPSATLGATITLVLFNSNLNVISVIGMVLLVGLVMKNAIMMINFALQAERDQGMDTAEAIQQACKFRFRPIIMTSASAFFGAMPLAFGTGVGAELRRPLGLTIMGGLAVSQVLTLYTTPVVYLFLDRVRLRVFHRRASAPLPVLPQEAL